MATSKEIFEKLLEAEVQQKPPNFDRMVLSTPGNKSKVQRASVKMFGGVGKAIGGSVYFHKDYLDVVSSGTYKDIKDRVKKAEQRLSKEYPTFKYNLLKVTYPAKSFVTFYNSTDFDDKDNNEPVAGENIKVYDDENKASEKGVEKQIYHHKWQWVDNKYTGFDVKKSFQRSINWLYQTNTKINFGSIGRIPAWEAFLKKAKLKLKGEDEPHPQYNWSAK